MEYIAESKNIKMSPRKIRLVATAVKQKNLSAALAQLTVLNKRAAMPIRKAIQSAIANATNNFNVNRDALVLKDILVNEGISYKRYHYAARGRIRPYKKRTSHIKVILVDKVIEPMKEKKTETKEVQALQK